MKQYINLKNCKVCNTDFFKPNLVTLKNVPDSAQIFRKKKKRFKIQLKIYQCSGCGLVQVINKPVTYYKEVIRAVGTSKKMMNFRLNQFKQFKIEFNLKNKRVIEIGCGRGDYLKILNKVFKKVYGLEGSRKNFKYVEKKKLKVIYGFPEKNNYKIANFKFDAFFIFSYLEHIPNLRTFLRGIYNNLSSNAVGVVEVPNFNMILKNKLYSEFIIDHLYYFTKKTLEILLENNGFKIIKIKEIFQNYILSAQVKKKQVIELEDFNKISSKLNKSVSKFVKKYSNKKKIAVWGAGHQALTLISMAKIEKYFKYIVDSANFKQKKYAPGTNLMVVAPEVFKNDNIKVIIVLAAGYTDEVCKIVKSYNLRIKIAKIHNNVLSIIN